MRGIPRLIPIAAVVGRIMQLAALDNQPLQRTASRQDCRLVVISESRIRVEPTPICDIAVLDDDVMPTDDVNCANWPRTGIACGACASQRETANDDIGGVNRYAIVVLMM